jgi:hypothetical protein
MELPPLTTADVLALPATVPLSVGNRALGIGRTTGYTLARQGRYPCKVIRVGKTYRVATADLRRVLGLHSADERPKAVPA